MPADGSSPVRYSSTGTVTATASRNSHESSNSATDSFGKRNSHSLKPHFHHHGNAEDDAEEQARAKKRMEERIFKEEKMKMEEKEDTIRDKFLAGELTDEEAQKLMARGKMHNKDEEGGKLKIEESAAAGADYATTQAMIEDVLDTEDKIYFVRWIKRVTGWSRLMRAAKKERQKRQKVGYHHKFLCIEKLVHGKEMRVEVGMSKDKEANSSAFELILGFVLMVNGVLIGIQASVTEPLVRTLNVTMSPMINVTRSFNDTTNATVIFENVSAIDIGWQNLQQGGDDITSFIVLEHCFTAIFTFELAMRLLADGWIWLVEGLNFADFMLIVVTGILPMWIFGPLGIKSNELRILQVLRVLRLIKIVRMVRTVPMFRIFWSLIRGLLDSGRTLLWTYIMIGAVLYIFAIFGVYLIGKDSSFADAGDDEAAEIALEYFGDVPKCFITLFQTMTLDSWTAIARPLMRHSDVVAPYFILVILMVVLALGNLVTAVIIDNANDASSKDQELKASEKRGEMEKEIKALKDIFIDIDTDGSGILSKEEYMEALHTNEKVQEVFEHLGISNNEREEIFELLDVNGKGVNVDKFASGLRDMQGDAKAKDSFTICKKIGHLNNRLNNLSTKLKKQQAIADELQLEIQEAHRQMGGMLLDLRQVMSYLTVCMPPEAMGNQRDIDKKISTLDSMLAKKKTALHQQDQRRPRALEDDRLRTTPSRHLVPKSVGFSEVADTME
jgi:hypothetical protein